MILADTSAWVEYDRATGSAVDRRLSELIAAVAWRYKATLLACDVDLDRVARVIGVELAEPARPASP